MDAVKVYKGEVDFNFTHIFPTNSLFPDHKTRKSYRVAAMKFDISNFD